MNDIRVLFQSHFNTIADVDCGPAKPDGMVEQGKTYLGYELAENFLRSDFDKNYSMEIAFSGRLVRKIDPTENTLQIIDEALEELKEKLKDLNVKYSYRDVSDYQDGFKKIVVTGTVKYNELNNKLIV